MMSCRFSQVRKYRQLKSMSHLRRITSVTRRPVHRSVAKPNDFGLRRNQVSTCRAWFAESFVGRGGGGWAFNPASPRRRNFACQAYNVRSVTFRNSATSGTEYPFWSLAIASRRRRSSSAAVPLGLMTHAMQAQSRKR